MREISTDRHCPMHRLCLVTSEFPEQNVRIWPKSRHWLSDVQTWAEAGVAAQSQIAPNIIGMDAERSQTIAEHNAGCIRADIATEYITNISQ